jgi:hypothetical protein
MIVKCEKDIVLFRYGLYIIKCWVFSKTYLFISLGKGFTVKNVLKLLASVGVLMLAVGCADVPNAPEISGDVGTAAAEDAGVNNPVQSVDEGQLTLDASAVTFLKESDLKANTQHPLASVGKKNPDKSLSLNINQLNSEKAISLSATDAVVNRKANALAKTAALADPGSCQVYTGYLTGTGDEAYLYPIPVPSGELLTIQVDMPNSAALDYDAYLYEIGASGNLTLVDWSEYITHINNPNGTVPEAVGDYNKSNTTKNYLLVVASYQGGSSTLPFTIHVCIRANNAPFDSYEPDEHAHKAISFNLDVPNPSISFRSMNTLCDNDWYTFVSPASIEFNSVLFTLDATSVDAGYTLEVYEVANSGGLKRTATTVNGRVLIGLNTRYYVRVTSTGAHYLTGVNYTFTLYPDYYVNSITVTGYEDGDGMVTYCQGYPPTYTRYRVRGGGQITVKGIVRYKTLVIPNATVKFTFYNPYYPANTGGSRTITVTSNSSGAFSATLPVGPAMGDYSCVFGSPTPFQHTFDIDYFTLESGFAVYQNEVFLLASDGKYW